MLQRSIPLALRSKAWVCGCLVAGITGAIPAGNMDIFVSVVCCQIEVAASGCSLVQRSLTECGMSECDPEASIMGGPGPLGLLRHGEKK
jgi:hypothetical protein